MENVRQAGESTKTARLNAKTASLKDVKRQDGRRNKKRLERIPETGAFLTVQPSCRDGTKLAGIKKGIVLYFLPGLNRWLSDNSLGTHHIGVKLTPPVIFNHWFDNIGRLFWLDACPLLLLFLLFLPRNYRE